MKLTKKILLPFLCLFLNSIIFAQSSFKTLTNYTPLRYGKNGIKELPTRLLGLNLENKTLLERQLLENKEMTIAIPLLDNKEEITFIVHATKTMHEDLAAKYPDIHTFAGYNRTNPSEMLSLTFAQSGLWGTVQLASGNYYIEPDKNNSNYAILFAAKEDPRKPTLGANQDWCNVGHDHKDGVTEVLSPTFRDLPTAALPGDAYHPTGDNLLIYRAAMMMGAEACQSIAGGSKPTALAWLNNLVNSANNVLIRDVALKMELIANNDAIIFTLPSTLPLPTAPYNVASIPAGMQPFPSPPYNPTTTLLSYCMPTLNAYIGAANYDVGYLHNEGIGGGWAIVGALNFTDKGKGIGDADYEIFIHEFGHMGGSPHNIVSEGGIRTTFGGTIMGHRGNTRSSSGDQYSSHTMDYFTQSCYGGPNNAAQNIASGNTIPSLTVPTSGFYIPKSTPFKLTGTATDPDAGQTLTYTWEENDSSTVTFTHPNFPSNTGPLFWSVFPTTDGATRYFPDLSYLTTNTTNTGETMPFATRKLNFRCIVRDNFPTCGGANFKNVRFNVDGASGPFEVTSFNTSGTVITGNTTQTVTWNSNNTQNAPVSCSMVNIRLSNDGGLTYPTLLATVPNTGTANVLFPNTVGTTKRIMIEGVGNIFFDINNANFEIADAAIAALNTQISVTEKVIHTQTSTSVSLSCQAVGSFSGTAVVTLSGVPSGASATFPNGQNTITLTPNFTTTLTFSNLGSVARGRYPITITTTGGAIIKTTVFNLIKTGTAATTPGNALSLSSGAYATISNIEIPSENVTFSAWIKRDNVPYSDNETVFFFPNAPVTGSMPGFYIHDTDGDLRYHQSWWTVSNQAIVNNEWTFVAVVVTPSQATIYKNGVPAVISLGDNSQRPFSGVMNIGKQTSSWREFNGKIEEAKIWKRALTTQEIREQMHLTSHESAADSDLFSYYQFNQSSGACQDVIRSYDLTLQSGATYTASGAAVGTGAVTTQTVNSSGTTAFSNSELSINFGTAPSGDVVVTNLTNIVPNGTSATSNSTTSNYWIINNYGTTNTGLNASMAFSPASGFLQNTTASNYKLYKRPSTSVGTWDAPITATSVNVPTNKVVFSGINSFSQFLISSTSILPIRLLNFTATLLENSSTQLHWVTANEQNSKQFSVERSEDAIHFYRLEYIQARGNSNTEQRYTTTDANLSNGTHYYRLGLEDTDGHLDYSPTVSITKKGEQTLVAYPNPNYGHFTLRLADTWQRVEIYNALGQTVYTRNATGETLLDIALDQVATGIYWVNVWTEEGTISTQLILK